MSNSLQVFAYKEQEVRTAMIDGEIWFVASDICHVLELSNTTEALKALDEDEKNTLRISEGNRGNPTVNVISEPGEPYAVMLDTGKKHSDGTPVRQLKWDSTILQHSILSQPRTKRAATYAPVCG